MFDRSMFFVFLFFVFGMSVRCFNVREAESMWMGVVEKVIIFLVVNLIIIIIIFGYPYFQKTYK